MVSTNTLVTVPTVVHIHTLRLIELVTFIVIAIAPKGYVEDVAPARE